MTRVGLVERERIGSGLDSDRVEKGEVEDVEMEEEQNRPEGESERWKWLWKVVPCEDLLLDDASIGCTFQLQIEYFNGGKGFLECRLGLEFGKPKKN